MNGGWVSHDTRDAVDLVDAWSAKAEIPQARFIRSVGVSRGKLLDWKQRYAKVSEHNSEVPRDHWLEKWEQQAILAYQAPIRSKAMVAGH